MCGQKLPPHNPARANQLGMCLLPEDRKVEGLALALSIRENIVISSLHEMNPNGVIAGRKERQVVQQSIDSLGIATSTMDKLVKFLSGGTQQKVVVAKWLLSHSKVFIFDEPTRGIDVGAKSSIYQLMDDLVSQGAAILMISSDMTEIMGMSDRIYVMSGGSVVGELDSAQANQNDILQLAFPRVSEVSRDGEKKECGIARQSDSRCHLYIPHRVWWRHPLPWKTSSRWAIFPRCCFRRAR